MIFLIIGLVGLLGFLFFYLLTLKKFREEHMADFKIFCSSNNSFNISELDSKIKHEFTVDSFINVRINFLIKIN
jgi:hypothetical protein